jgi:hypothetical protein
MHSGTLSITHGIIYNTYYRNIHKNLPQFPCNCGRWKAHGPRDFCECFVTVCFDINCTDDTWYFIQSNRRFLQCRGRIVPYEVCIVLYCIVSWYDVMH